MSNLLWKTITVSNFSLTAVRSSASKVNSKRKLIDFKTGKDVTYHFTPVHKEPSHTTNVRYFPVIINNKGEPWKEASLYLLYRLETEYIAVDSISNNAYDLCHFKNYLTQENFNLNHFPKNKSLNVIKRYSSFLRNKILTGKDSISTSKRRMSTILNFYRWLIKNEHINLAYEPWEEKEIYFSFTNSVGRVSHKRAVTTNVSINVPESKDPFENSIADGGKLTPLELEEQKDVLDALFKINNIEMTLIFLIALFTGARIQTVLTLKSYHFDLEIPEDLEEIRLAVGIGTGVDTKYDKRYTLFFSRWLYDKVKIYKNSERYKYRVEKSTPNVHSSFLFLTNRGEPYYESKENLENSDVTLNSKQPKKGGAVRFFLNNTLIRKINCNRKNKLVFRFHDLRATFGMNLTDAQMMLVQNGVITLHQAREFVKSCMGHSSSRTTDIYLNYRGKLKHLKNVQNAYETHLSEIAEIACNKL